MRFIGNKTRLLMNIQKVIENHNIKGETFCDIFAGSGSVGDYFKDKYTVISNDYLYFLSVINKAKLSYKETPVFSTFFSAKKQNIFEYLNTRDYHESPQYFITSNYVEDSNRKYFTKQNAIKIDGIRIEIENLYRDKFICDNEYAFLLASLIESVMGVSNTTGTYEAFLKHWDNRALKDFIIQPLEINNVIPKDKPIVYNEDSNILIREIKGDILYLDPPYTITDYSNAYHLLESLAKYDYPEIRGKTGRRIAPNHKSKYNHKQKALINFEDLIRQADFKHIIISYSTQGLIPINELKLMLQRFAVDKQVYISYFPYREYKNIRESNKGGNLREVVIYFEKDLSIIKSPLNYTGSKDGIFQDINKNLPRKISTFIDAMGGAFNVGVNIVANEVVYNEYLPHVYNLVDMLLNNDKNTIIHKVEHTILKYNLTKSDKECYYNLRSAYNSSKDIIKLFTLQMYCFQNQMRFNSKLLFNTPVGNCSYNDTIRNRVLNFVPKTSNFKLYNCSYKDIDFTQYDKDSLFYFDPPYFITSATYHDGKRGFDGWDADKETELLDYLYRLHENGYKFMLSNVVYHKEKTNHILIKWIETHKFHIYSIKNVGSKMQRNEVIITNYDWRKS